VYLSIQMDKCAFAIGGVIIGRLVGNVHNDVSFVHAVFGVPVTGLALAVVGEGTTPKESMAYILSGFGCGLLLTNLSSYLGDVIHQYIDANNVRLRDIHNRLDNIERNTRPPTYPIA
jgi:hypothetical protein